MAKSPRQRHFLLTLLCLISLVGHSNTFGREAAHNNSADPRPPAISEPDYAHAAVAKSTAGRWDHQYWLFTPDQPRPAKAPVVLFFHGWMQLNPVGYGAWLQHLVRQGNIVIYPRYQAGPLTDPKRFLDNAGVAIREALASLEADANGVQPDRTRVIAAGHSMGGLLAVNYAATAAAMELPTPSAVYSLQPGKTTLMPLADLSELPAELELLANVGDIDRITGDTDARAIIRKATSLADHQRVFVEFRTDTHGRPGLYASHGSPLARHDAYNAVTLAKAIGEEPDIFLAGDTFWAGPPDVLDTRGYWALLDLLMARAFKAADDTDAEVLPGLDTAVSELSLGVWSDGTPIRKPRVWNAGSLESER